MIELKLYIMHEGAPTEELNTEVSKITSFKGEGDPDQLVLKIAQYILSDSSQYYPNIVFKKEEGWYKGETGPNTWVAYFIEEEYDKNVDFLWSLVENHLP